jgi:hypothetical protein
VKKKKEFFILLNKKLIVYLVKLKLHLLLMKWFLLHGVTAYGQLYTDAFSIIITAASFELISSLGICILLTVLGLQLASYGFDLFQTWKPSSCG